MKFLKITNDEGYLFIKFENVQSIEFKQLKVFTKNIVYHVLINGNNGLYDYEVLFFDDLEISRFQHFLNTPEEIIFCFKALSSRERAVLLVNQTPENINVPGDL